MSPSLEQTTDEKIDTLPEAVGMKVCDAKVVDGHIIRDPLLQSVHGFADYLLYIGQHRTGRQSQDDKTQEQV